MLAVKSPAENFISKFARYYTPVVVVLAILLAVIHHLFSLILLLMNGFIEH